MPVPQGVPLTLSDYGDDRVVLQQQHAPRGDQLCALGKGTALVWLVHDAETVKHHVGRRRDRPETAVGEQGDPGASVRAAEFENRFSPQPTGLGDPPDRVPGLVPQRLRFHRARLVGNRVVLGQLRETA